MDNPEILATLATHDTGRRQKNPLKTNALLQKVAYLEKKNDAVVHLKFNWHNIVSVNVHFVQRIKPKQYVLQYQNRMLHTTQSSQH